MTLTGNPTLASTRFSPPMSLRTTSGQASAREVMPTMIKSVSLATLAGSGAKGDAGGETAGGWGRLAKGAWGDGPLPSGAGTMRKLGAIAGALAGGGTDGAAGTGGCETRSWPLAGALNVNGAGS